MKALLKAATEPFKSLLLFLIETGCRPQEAIAIEPEYIQGDKVVLPVKESKGKKYARVIYLTEKAKKALGGGFRNTRGVKWTAYSINCRMRRLAKKTGKHIAAYDLRHYTLTRWLESGLDHITVSSLAGHRSSAMLSRHYSHIGGDFLLEQLKKIK